MSISGIQSSDGSVIITGGGDTVNLRVNTGSGGVQLGQDLGGSNSAPVVIGIQTISVSATTPVTGEALILTSGVWTPTAIPLGISPGTGIGVASSSGIFTVSNTGVLSFNTRNGAVTLTAADVESTFNAKGDIFLGTGSGTGTILPIGSSTQILTVSGGTAVWATAPASGVTSVTAGAGGSLTISPTTGAVVASRAALTGDVTASADSNTTAIKSSVNLSGSPTATTQAALDNSTKIATTAYADAAVAAEALLRTNAITVTAIKTSAYNINANELAQADASGGSFVFALPNAPADKTLAGVVSVTAPGANTITINRSGSDTILTTSATSATIRINGELKLWQYTASTKVWTPISQIPVSSLTAFILASPAMTGVPTAPTAAAGDNTTQVATDAFVTTAVANAIAGVNPAIAVKVATTAAGDTSGLTYANGVSGVGATLTGTINTPITIDGVLLNTLGNRLLVKNDTQSPSGAFNGIYSLTVISTAGTAPVFTRALDYDQPSDINNTGAIPVQSGTANAGTSWLLTSLVTTVGTDPLTYVQFNYTPAQVVTAANIEKTFTAKGQLYAGTGSAGGELLAAGSHGQELRINGSDASGMAWNSPMLFQNYIESGCVWTADGAGSLQTASMSAGVCWIAGVRLTVAAVVSHSFATSRDTYVDFTDNNDGTAAVTYSAVANNAASPALASTSALTIRNAIVITNSTVIPSGNNSNPISATLNAINQGDTWATLPIASSIPYSVSDSLGNLIYPTSASGQLLSYRQIVSSFTTSTSNSPVDVTGLSVTFIVPSGPSRRVRIQFWNAAMSTTQTGAGSQLIAIIRNGSTTLTEAAAMDAGVSDQVFATPVFIANFPPGTYTIKASVEQVVISGTMTVVAATTIPAFIAAELV